MRWLNQFADARESYHGARGAPTALEAAAQRKWASAEMIHAEQKLVQLFNSIRSDK